MIKIDHEKFSGKINGDRVSINQILTSFKKVSALIRKVFTAADPSIIKIDHVKFNGKITGDRVSINQILTSFKNLQCKYLSNEYLDYKSRALHGKTQFNSNLAHYKHNVQKWCKHCLEMGIRTSENFEHAVYTCPQIQYIMHRIKIPNSFVDTAKDTARFQPQ